MIRIHFINVGHGDCVIVEFLDSKRVAVIDINMTEDMDETTKNELVAEALNESYNIKIQNPINYMNSNNIGRIFRFISTHPHMDHLSGIKELHDNKGIGTLWISKNNHDQNEAELTDSQKDDWRFYKKYRDTNDYLLDGVYTIRPQAGDSHKFWDEDNIKILSPDSELLNNSNPNNLSYVLLIEYGGKKIVLGGDAENDSWDYIMNKYSDLIKDVSILKASHHGRDNGYHQKAVEHMHPMYTIVSVGKKPSTDASNKYRQYSKYVWSTRWKGNIVFEIHSDGRWSFSTQYDD